MEIMELNQLIDKEIARIDEYHKGRDDKERLMASALKIGEELGELYNELLAHKGYQRKSKLEKLDKEEIEKEIADVIITTFILARKLEINIEDALKLKLDKLKQRSYN